MGNNIESRAQIPVRLESMLNGKEQIAVMEKTPETTS